MTYSEWVCEVSSQSPPPPFTIETLLNKIGAIFNRLGMGMKYCKGCDRDLPLSAFHNDKKMKDGLAFYCRECVSEYGKKYSVTPNGIYNGLKGLQRYYVKRRHHRAKPFLITRKDFVEWYENEPKICHYCGIPEEILNDTGDRLNSRMLRFTVDCMDNDKGYVLGNIVLACNRCNFMKSDYLTYEEMLFYAKTYVTPKWKAVIEPNKKKEES